MFRHNTKTLKNKLFNDKGGNAFYLNLDGKSRKNGKNRFMKGLKTNHKYFNALFKAHKRSEKFKIITRRL